MQTSPATILPPDTSRPLIADAGRAARESGFVSGIEILRPVEPGEQRAGNSRYDCDEAGAPAARAQARPAAAVQSAAWEQISVSRWQAPAALTFAAQRFAQEEMGAGLHLEDFPPAIRAYARAQIPLSNGARPPTGLPVWV